MWAIAKVSKYIFLPFVSSSFEMYVETNMDYSISHSMSLRLRLPIAITRHYSQGLFVSHKVTMEFFEWPLCHPWDTMRKEMKYNCHNLWSIFAYSFCVIYDLSLHIIFYFIYYVTFVPHVALMLIRISQRSVILKM